PPAGLRVNDDRGMNMPRRVSPIGRRLAVGIFLIVIKKQDLHSLGALAERGRQAVVSRIGAGKQRVAALRRNIDAVEHSALGGIFVIALVGVKLHVAIG